MHDPSPAAALLPTLRALFRERGAERLPTEEIVAALTARQGRPITAQRSRNPGANHCRRHVGSEDASAARLRFPRWYTGKLLPRVYGDRMEVEQTVRAVVSDEPMTVEEWVAKYGRRDGDAPTTH